MILSVLFSQTVQISVDKNKLEEGDLFSLNIEVTGGDDFAKVDLNPLNKDFEILSGPFQQTNIQWINGKMTSTKTLTWNLAPKRSGRLVIPVLKGNVGSKNFRSKAIPIQVVKTGMNDDESIFIFADLDKEKVYLGEQISLTYKLYKQVDLKIVNIDQFEMPDFKGFWVEEIFTPKRLQYQAQQEVINGIKYHVANLGQRALFPIPSDKHAIPSVIVNTQLEIKKKKRKDPFFDPFFDSFFSETKTRILKSKEKNITIKSFPEPRPFDFSGAVGNFNLFSSIDEKEAKVNEGFTFTISLNGTGNIGLFALPEIEFPNGLEVFPPTDNFKKDAFRNALTGLQTWEYILIPRKDGLITIPRIQMSYFEPQSSSWMRIQTKPHVINILPNDKEISSNSGLTKREIELIGQDIRFIHTEQKYIWNPKKQQINFAIIFYSTSIFIFVLPLFLSKYTGYMLSTADARQVRGSLRESLKLLKKIDNDPFETASNAVYFYLKNKLLLKSHNLDPVSVEKVLTGLIEKDLIKEIVEILQLCDAGRFSPENILKKEIILGEISDLLKRLDKELR